MGTVCKTSTWQSSNNRLNPLSAFAVSPKTGKNFILHHYQLSIVSYQLQIISIFKKNAYGFPAG